ncbi:hypothetical protein [Pseudonocardia sp. DSM 110487]|nr:hypothetical protein [Pseudonocardia sp. DSM 110487]
MITKRTVIGGILLALALLYGTQDKDETHAPPPPEPTSQAVG